MKRGEYFLNKLPEKKYPISELSSKALEKL